MGEVLRAIARISGVATHFGDGIRFESEGTVHLTGPGAMRDGMADYANARLSAAAADTLYKEAGIAPHLTVNGATEEEQNHSWKENGSQPENGPPTSGPVGMKVSTPRATTATSPSYSSIQPLSSNRAGH